MEIPGSYDALRAAFDGALARVAGRLGGRLGAYALAGADLAVFLGRVTPVVRSFISIPAGVVRMPLPRFTVLTLLGSAIWCFVLAGIGWAIGKSWHRFHEDFRFVATVNHAAIDGNADTMPVNDVCPRPVNATSCASFWNVSGCKIGSR